MLKYVVWIVLALLVSSCASKTNNIYRTSETELNALSQVLINNEELGDWHVALSTLGYDGDAVAFSMYQASMNASSTPNSAPGAGLAGALIGGAIIKSHAQSAAQKSKDEPVQSILNKLSAEDWSEFIKTSVASLQDREVHLKNTVTRYDIQEGPVLFITPELEITANYLAIELHAHVEVITPGNKSVYSNYFHLQSEPLFTSDMVLGDINSRPISFFQAQTESLVTRLMKLVLEELDGRLSQGEVQSIRFTNYMGGYFERGYFINNAEGYITFKTLRGEIKQYPVSENIE